MAEWKREARRLAKDFYLSKSEIQGIFKRVEERYSKREMPLFYKGNKDEFLYDKAQKEIMSIVLA